MANEWGQSLKQFRNRTGLTQSTFSDKVSTLSIQCSESEMEALREIGIEHMVLANYELSRYENGRRMPRYRSRYVSLIWALERLGGIQSIEEANEWLESADQSPLTKKEISAIFPRLASIHDEAPVSDATYQPNVSKPAAARTSSWSSLRRRLPILAGAFLLVAGIAAACLMLPASQPSVPATVDPSASEPNVSVESSPTPEVSNRTVGENANNGSNNLVQNGTFDHDLEGWHFWEQNDGSQRVSLENGQLCSHVLNGANHYWEVSLRHHGMDLKANTLYRISFDVEVDTERNLGVNIKQHIEPYVGYFYSAEPLRIGRQSVELDYVQHVAEPNARLSFWLGGHGTGKVCIDNVSLIQQGVYTLSSDTSQEPETIPNNPIVNGDFSQGHLYGWWISEQNGGAFALYIQDGELCSRINQPGKEVWDLTIGQHITELATGGEYQISFEAYASHRLNVRAGVDRDNYEVLELTNEPSSFLIDIRLGPDESTASLTFRFGDQESGTLCFDNIAMVQK